MNAHRLKAGRQRKLPVCICCLVSTLGLTLSGAKAGAAEGGFYGGVAIAAGSLDVAFDKTVDNRAPDTLVPEPRRGMAFRDKVSGDGFVHGAGPFAGFRMKLAGTSLYLGVEADMDFRGGEADGEFGGIGTSAGRNQLGEHWPDRWTYEGDLSYGFALRLSGSPGALRSLDMNLYASGGLRWLDGKFTNRFHGCLSPVPCSDAPGTPAFTSGTEKLDTDLKGWMAALGVEKTVRPQLVLRVEGRYTQFKAKRWTTLFDDLGVTVPVVLNADELGVSLSLAWHPQWRAP